MKIARTPQELRKCGLKDKFNTFFLRQFRHSEIGEKTRKKINPSIKRRLIQARTFKIALKKMLKGSNKEGVNNEAHNTVLNIITLFTVSK